MTQESSVGRLRVGMELKKDNVVGREHTANAVGSGGLEVLATPVLATWVENAAYEMASLIMPDEETTVGAEINLKHIAPTPVGMKVRVRVYLKEVEGRKLTFDVEAWDTVQKVAEGTHIRYVVDKVRFMEKVIKKRD